MATRGSLPEAHALREYVRAHGSAFLADPNVTSVGVGHKMVAGRVTDEVCLQFTVRVKVPAERLSALPTSLLPEQVEVGEHAVATDVVERTFAPAYAVVPEADSDARKVRADPVVPGISVAHPTVSAGTIGLVVHDREDGTPYVLSNWHVLQGDQGRIGDEVLQPGPHDDNRVGRNRLGVLVRSHLGAAGDCAIATVEGRGLDPEILELGVAPDEIGDPELGDKVVKSGRTTGVTYGVVTRVDVLSKLDYGAAGQREIGGFEIGPDAGHPATAGEISAGGDSGSAWVFRARNGRTSTVFAGLHFGGETPGDSGEHALACLPRSVFDRLGVTLDAGAAARAAQGAAQARADAAAAAGYDPGFLAHEIPLPTLERAAESDAVEVDGSTVVPYTHFSLTMSASRRFARWVAWNVDGAALLKLPRSREKFRRDPRVPTDAQVGDELYAGNRIDRGHLARRADLTWGAPAEAQRANADSFFFTNIAPQVDDFNQSRREGVWGRLEDAVYEQVEVADLRISVLGGPVFGADDPVYRGVALPREYWKVIAYVEGEELRARAFLLTQRLDRLESIDLDEFRTYQVSLTDLSDRTGVLFPDALGTGLPEDVRESVPEPLTDVGDIRW